MGNRRRYLLTTGAILLAFAGWAIWLVLRPRPPELVLNGRPLSVWRDLLAGTPTSSAGTILVSSGTVSVVGAAPAAISGAGPATFTVNLGSVTINGSNASGYSGTTVLFSKNATTVTLAASPAAPVGVPNTAVFTQMGTNAAPILLAIIDSSADDPLRILYRTIWPWMPRGIQTRYPRPPNVGPLLTNAALTLTQLGDTRFNIQLYKTQKSTFVRRFAILAIGFNANVKDKDATLTLIEALKDREAIIRQKAALGLAVYGRDHAFITAPLMKSLSDSDPLVRYRSAVALSAVPECRMAALPEVITGLGSKDAFIRAEAARILEDVYPGEGAKRK